MNNNTMNIEQIQAEADSNKALLGLSTRLQEGVMPKNPPPQLEEQEEMPEEMPMEGMVEKPVEEPTEEPVEEEEPEEDLSKQFDEFKGEVKGIIETKFDELKEMLKTE